MIALSGDITAGWVVTDELSAVMAKFSTPLGLGAAVGLSYPVWGRHGAAVDRPTQGQHDKKYKII